MNTGFAPDTSFTPLRPCAHTVQFYSKDDALISNIAEFIGKALNSGDAAVTICTGEHHDALEQELRNLRVDIAAAERQGRYIALDAAATLASFMRDGWPDGIAFNSVIGNVISKARAAAGTDSQVAAFGEMVAVLWANHMQEAAIRVEALWNALGRMQDFRLRCAYPVKFFTDEKHSTDLLNICAEHAHVVPAFDEGANFGMWELDLLSDQCSLSASASRLLGVPPGRVELGALLLKMYYSGDREAFASAIRQAGSRNRTINVEFRVSDPDGSIRFLACRGRTFANDGRLVLLGVLNDVTADRSAISDRLWLDDFKVS